MKWGRPQNWYIFFFMGKWCWIDESMDFRVPSSQTKSPCFCCWWISWLVESHMIELYIEYMNFIIDDIFHHLSWSVESFVAPMPPFGSEALPGRDFFMSAHLVSTWDPWGCSLESFSVQLIWICNMFHPHVDGW